MTTQLTHFVDEMDSPIGKLTIVATDQGVCHINFGELEASMVNIKTWLKKNGRKGELIRSKEHLGPVCEQLEDYFARKRIEFDLPVDLCGTPFQKKVWNALRTIEYGTTKSYKQIAQEIGAPKAIRAIGGANNKNPLPIIIPCHRVIGSNGNMVGYGGGLDKKEILLGLEGAIEQIS